MGIFTDNAQQRHFGGVQKFFNIPDAVVQYLADQQKKQRNSEQTADNCIPCTLDIRSNRALVQVFRRVDYVDIRPVGLYAQLCFRLLCQKVVVGIFNDFVPAFHIEVFSLLFGQGNKRRLC